jgi:hypothetical protein
MRAIRGEPNVAFPVGAVAGFTAFSTATSGPVGVAGFVEALTTRFYATVKEFPGDDHYEGAGLLRDVGSHALTDHGVLSEQVFLNARQTSEHNANLVTAADAKR